MENNSITVGLHLFDGEPAGEEKTSVPTQQTASGEEESVSAAEKQTTREAKRETFRALMEGEYKPFFTEYFQETFNRRFREQRSMREELEQQREITAALSTLCGSDKREDLLAFLRTESEKRALAGNGQAQTMESGEDDTRSHPTATVEDAENKAEGKEMPPLEESEGDTQKPQAARAAGEQDAPSQANTPPNVVHEAPSEMSNDVEARITAAVEKAVAAMRAETETALLASIRARGLRPAENGLQHTASPPSQNRARGLTRDQRADAARRAARGEYVEL